MKVLVQNFKYNHCMEVVEHKSGDETYKFKIEASNGNSYSTLKISILNSDGLHVIFDESDIPGYKYVNYLQDNTTRLNISKSNISAAEDLIKKVFK